MLLADRCEQLCGDIGVALEECMPESMDWTDFGARTRQEYQGECRSEWGRTSNDLSSRELELALDVCRSTSDQLPEWTCEEILALYAPVD